METKAIKDWEVEKGCIVKGADPDEQMSEADFDDIHPYEKVGVNHPDRIKFLEANGYEVTRENMIDSSLSTKQPEPEQPANPLVPVAADPPIPIPEPEPTEDTPPPAT